MYTMEVRKDYRNFAFAARLAPRNICESLYCEAILAEQEI